MLAPTGEIHVFHGLLWSPAWFFEHEGPYTKLAKISLINLANSKTLNRHIFNATDITWDAEIVHGRSLIYTRWMSQIASAKACDNLPSALQRSSWLLADGSGAMQMATDKHFRYCPACLDLGFQSSLMQIVGLDKCPVHGLPLRDRCMHCNALCPRYAVCRDAFEQPMRCVKCGRLYARAWAPEGMISSWKGVEDGTGFIRVENWLQRAGNLLAPKLRDPEMRDLQIEQQRRVIFDFLRQEVPLDLSAHRPITVRRSNGLVSQLPPFDGHPELLARRVGIFKSIRRHFERVLGIKKLWRVERSFNDLEQGFLGPLFSAAGRTPPSLHGFLLWRARFEGTTEFPGCSRRRRALRVDGLHHIYWPEDPRTISWNISKTAIDCSTWGLFVLFCLKKDLQSAGKWNRAVAKARELSHGEERSFVPRRREILSQMGWQLRPDAPTPPAGIGLITSGDRALLYAVLDHHDGTN